VIDDAVGSAAQRVPLSAIARRDGRAVIWTVSGTPAKVQPRPVTVQAVQDNDALVTSGVRAASALSPARICSNPARSSAHPSSVVGNAMRGPNLSSWAVSHRAVIRFALVLAVLAGVYAYWALGRQEDPDFTLKNMMVSAAWPGASADEMAGQVAEPIERAIQTLPEVDYLRTNVQPGRVIVNVKVREDVPTAALPGVWNRIRQRVQDHAGQLPDGVVGPQFNDDFGDTYGNIYALSGDGFSLPQLKQFADRLRDQFRQLPDVGRVEFEGEPQERIYIEYESAKLATLGISPAQIVQTLRDTNTVASSGIVDLAAERIRIDVTGTFDSVDAIRRIGIAAQGRSVRLGDIATVRRGSARSAHISYAVNGRDAVGLMVSLRKGGNVTRLGSDSEALIEAFRAQLPVGVNIDIVANQPNVVQVSIGEFSRSLVEAVVIVLAVSFFSLGWRPGIVVALCIPIVFALTFATMLALWHPAPSGVAGALIIALGCWWTMRSSWSSRSIRICIRGGTSSRPSHRPMSSLPSRC
jgi:multidrug efflux pump